MKYSDLNVMIARVLDHYGGYYENTPFVNADLYHDKKIIIYGIRDVTGENYIYLSVWLTTKAFQMDHKIPRYTHPRIAKEATPVCFNMKGDLSIFRPGRWIAYVQRLHMQSVAEINALATVNLKPMDDYRLFSDIANSEIPTVTFD